jgi:16S rRNA (cytosine967-C5)-methyltransferase
MRVNARTVARDLLVSVEVDGAYANLVLPRLLRGLPERERGFATELGYGALRMQGTLDHLVDQDASRPIATVEPEVRAALRLGAYQLLATRTPVHAAVGETVELVPARARGFVNAVLRKTASRCKTGDPLGLHGLDRLDALALESAHPRWIVDAFAAALPDDELPAALAADSERPPVHLAALSVDRSTLPGTPGTLAETAVILEGGDPAEFVRTGSSRVQDEGSQVCALALSDALGGPATVVDLAAGPGGKAAMIASRGHRVVGLELHPHRAALVSVPVVIGDGRRAPFAPVDAVLLDAPCSGLGSLRRRPESRWRRRPEDLPGLVALQRELLAAATTLVKPGGLLAYVVCSPVVAEATAAVPAGFTALDVPALTGIEDGRAADEPTRLQLWPHRHGTDAMSCQLFRREA